MTPTARIATYHRVSTLDQNPKLARKELREAASRLGSLVMEVEEVGSGARNDRPGWQGILDAARRGQLDTVVVWKLDRAGRSTVDLLTNIEELQGLGVRFLAVTQGLDIKPGGDAMSKMLLTMLSAVSTFERDLIRERTRLGLAEARRRGVRLGGRPVLTKGQVTKVRALRAQGLSWAQVAKGAGCKPTTARRAVAAAG
jgi:DNA invertase Pin-like site-specific DNA recombinase